MLTIVLFVLAALAFTLLAGIIEARWARQTRRQLLESPPPVLHPLSHHRPMWIRPSSSRRALRHIGLFFGVLLVTYLGVALLKAVGSLLVQWLS